VNFEYEGSNVTEITSINSTNLDTGFHWTYKGGVFSMSDPGSNYAEVVGHYDGWVGENFPYAMFKIKPPIEYDRGIFLVTVYYW